MRDRAYQHIKPFFVRQATHCADDLATGRLPKRKAGFADCTTAAEFAGINSVVHPVTAGRGDANFETRTIKILRDANRLVIASQATFVDRIIKRRAPSMLNPAVDRCHELHRPEPLRDKSQGVALIVVAVPDGDAVCTAELDELADDVQIQRTPVLNSDDARSGDSRPPLEYVKTDVTGRMQVGTDAVVAHLLQK